jgi:hypothetical protein
LAGDHAVKPRMPLSLSKQREEHQVWMTRLDHFTPLATALTDGSRPVFLAISTVLNHSTTAASFGGREGRASGLPAAEPLPSIRDLCQLIDVGRRSKHRGTKVGKSFTHRRAAAEPGGRVALEPAPIPGGPGGGGAGRLPLYGI